MASKRSKKDEAIAEVALQRKKWDRITPAQQEHIYKTYMAQGENMAKTARTLDVSYRTVRLALKKFQENIPVEQRVKARREVADHLTERMDLEINRILDSIQPEDLESGRIPIKNAKGEITGYTYFGPSLLQKTTSIGILTDKLKVLREFERGITDDQTDGRLLMPTDGAQLIEAIRNKMTSLRVLDIHFEKNNPDLSTRLEQAIEVAAVDAAPNSGDPGLRPFDNQG